MAVAPTVPIYRRQSSGLVRTGKPLDAFLFNLNNAVVGAVVGWILLFGIALYPGSNVLLSMVIALVLSLGASFTYALFASIMPRSGGDYVFIGRTFHPSIGFAINGSFAVWSSYFIGVFGALTAQLAVSAILREIARGTGNLSIAGWANWFSTSWGKFATGIVLMALFAPMLFLSKRGGLRSYLTFQKIAYSVAVTTFVLLVILTVFMSHPDFVRSFNIYMSPFSGKGDTYSQILKAGGGHGGFDFKQTLLAVTWPFFTAGFMVYSSVWAGEHKTGLRTHLIAMPLSLVLALLLEFIAVAVSQNAYGVNFLNALGNVDPSKFGLGFTPYYFELLGTWTGPIIAVVLALGVSLWLFPIMPMVVILVTRPMFAYSFDGIMPEWLSRVDRTGNPRNAMLACYFLGLLGLLAYSFTGIFAVTVGLLGALLVFLTTCLAGIVFPFRRRDLYEGSPGDIRILGIPLLTITGTLGALGLIAVAIILLADQNSGTGWPTNKLQIFYTAGMIVFLFVVYWVSAFIRRRQGINLNSIFRALPPE